MVDDTKTQVDDGIYPLKLQKRSGLSSGCLKIQSLNLFSRSLSILFIFTTQRDYTMKIYTKTGDKGMTGLFGGARVSKDDIRIEAYGTLDELNAFIGTLLSSMNVKGQNEILTEVQNRLFTIGSNLASDPAKEMITPDLTEADIKILEDAIDNMNESLAPLRAFILPGGSVAVGIAHQCRTICRRAERRVVTLSNVSEVDSHIGRYLNRLSDYLFVLSRMIAMEQGVDEVNWVPRKS